MLPRGAEADPGLEPTEWLVAFQTRTTWRWVSWLAWGRFKHVLAFGFLPRVRCWVFYEVSIGRTRVLVAPDGPAADSLIAEAIEGAQVLRMSVRPQVCAWPVFGWCVPSIAHLLGIRSSALRPDSLWRHCLAHGAVQVELTADEDAQGQGIQRAEGPT